MEKRTLPSPFLWSSWLWGEKSERGYSLKKLTRENVYLNYSDIYGVSRRLRRKKEID